MSPAVARRYARALYEIGKESGTLPTILEEVERAAAAYASSAELREVLDNPIVGLAAQRAIVTDIAEALKLGPVTRNFIHLIADRRRLHVLPEIAKSLRQFGDAAQGVVHAEVTVAARLDESFYTRLQGQLEKMTGKKVVLARKEDPSLIAGVVTRIGDAIYDGSLQTRLASLKTALLPN